MSEAALAAPLSTYRHSPVRGFGRRLSPAGGFLDIRLLSPRRS